MLFQCLRAERTGIGEIEGLRLLGLWCWFLAASPTPKYSNVSTVCELRLISILSDPESTVLVVMAPVLSSRNVSTGLSCRLYRIISGASQTLPVLRFMRGAPV